MSTNYLDRARALAKEHPTVVLVAAAGAGLLVAAEFTVGAIVGLGAAAILGKKLSPEQREELRRRGEKLWRDTREQGQWLLGQGDQILRRGRKVWPFGKPEDQANSPSQS